MAESVSTPYAVDNLLDGGTVLHEIVDDGLTLVSNFSYPEGKATTKVGWGDLATAQENYEAARRAAVERADKVLARLRKLSAGGAQTDESRIRYLLRTRRGDLSLYTNAGPPTWWLPRARLTRWGVGGGWLRACFELKFSPRDG